MSKFIEKLKEGTKKTLSTITGKAKDYMREQQQESIRMQRIQQNEAVYNFMCRIQYALFTAFHGKNYGLAPPAHMRRDQDCKVRHHQPAVYLLFFDGKIFP